MNLNNFINYNDIIEKLSINIKNIEIKKDITVIIPIMGRENQIQTICEHFMESINFFPEKTYRIIFVENDVYPKNKDKIESCNCDYVFLEKNENKRFNKCLCMNIGALLVDSEYYLFHDVDLVVKKDFFKNVFLNMIKNNNHKVLHCLSDRRVVYLNNEKSEMVRSNILDINTISQIEPYSLNSNFEIMYGNIGAPGGSIIIHNKLFKQVGGYDDNIFDGYSPEDDFFWRKVEVLHKIDSCNEPKNELFHLHHDSLQFTKLPIHEQIKNEFILLPQEAKLNYINLKSKNFIYEKVI